MSNCSRRLFLIIKHSQKPSAEFHTVKDLLQNSTQSKTLYRSTIKDQQSLEQEIWDNHEYAEGAPYTNAFSTDTLTMSKSRKVFMDTSIGYIMSHSCHNTRLLVISNSILFKQAHITVMILHKNAKYCRSGVSRRPLCIVIS